MCKMWNVYRSGCFDTSSVVDRPSFLPEFFFFFFPPTISPDPLIYKLLLCKIYLSIVKLFGNVEYL